MTGHDLLALPVGDGLQNLPDRLAGAEREPCRDRVLGSGLQHAPIVDAPDIAHDKSRTD